MKKLGKRKFITLLAVGIALLILPLVAVCCAIFCAATNDGRKTPSDFTKSWMQYIDDDTLLRNVVIPGSHDAGTSTMVYYGKTQSLTVKEQMDCGARYFDLRVQNTGKELVIFHSILKGAAFQPILNDVKEFVIAHPTETVILDFQHFKDSHDEVCALLKSVLGSEYTVQNTTGHSDEQFINALTLGDARGKCLVFWGSSDDKNLQENFIFRRDNDEGTRPDSCLHSYYNGSYNRMSSAAYIEKGLPAYLGSYKQQNSGLFVLQGQLTDGLFVFGPRFRECTHYKNMQKYIDGLAASETLQSINIIMRDFVNSTKCAHIIRLNLEKHTVSAAQEQAFRTELSAYMSL